MHERLTSSVRTLVQQLSPERAATLVVTAAAVFALLFALSGYFALPTLPIHGHDEVHYYVSFYFKLVEDGRWLDFALHDFLRSVPLPLWSLLYLASFWLLFYRVARAIFDAPFAALVASTALLATPVMEISLWPASMMPAISLLWLALLLQARGVPYPLIYLTSGVLIFGAMQTLYFLLPLLFLPQFLDLSQPLRARLELLFKHMLWWVAGSVAGVFVVCVILWVLTGNYFPQPGAWRNTQPVVDLASLVSNIGYVLASFAAHVKALAFFGGVTWAFGIICSITALVRARMLVAQAPALLLMAAVLISFFLFSIPLAPIIHLRSLIAMALALILFVALLPGPSPLGRVLAALLLLRLAHAWSAQAQDYLEIQRAETAVFVSKLHELFPGYTTAYPRLALYGTIAPEHPEARRFNDPSLMHPIFVSLGVVDYKDCRIASRCDDVGLPGEVLAVQPFAGGRLELSADANKVGIVRYSKSVSESQ